MTKKTLADHLYEVMIEYNAPTVDRGRMDILEEVIQRSGIKITDSYHKLQRLNLSAIIHRVINTKRGKELFEKSGYIHYSGLINRPCLVLRIKKKL